VAGAAAACEARTAALILDSIVLASASPRRLELLRSLGLAVRVLPSAYGEPDDPQATPLELAVRHARAKAEDVMARVADARAIVAADTVVDLGGTVLGKPVDAEDAARMLRALSGREHVVHTAFALTLPGRRGLLEEAASTRVRFYRLDEDEIAAYVATGEPMDKAGAYGIQGRAAALVESIDGDFYTVMGFPLARFVRALRRSGFSLPAAKNGGNT
jgi:septum formation protein